GPADTSEDRCVAGDRQYLAGHVEDDLVGIPVGHHAAEAAAAGHAEAAGVVEDDQVDAARLGTLGAEAGTGAAADNGPPGGNLGAETLQTLLAGEQTHGSWSSRGSPSASGACGRPRNPADFSPAVPPPPRPPRVTNGLA